ncbi:MAG: hypothetical protein BYD32DRAFT_456507 [Podila humilis]|nr:MAG: hypothetical protein BYD32DRAFT_456507 [Podila humilis]
MPRITSVVSCLKRPATVANFGLDELHENDGEVGFNNDPTAESENSDMIQIRAFPLSRIHRNMMLRLISDVEQINILIFGQLWSCKSFSFEARKLYANPSFQPNLKSIEPNDIDAVRTLEVSLLVSYLHSIEIHKQQGDSDEHEVIGFKEQALTLSEETFEQL